MHMGVLLAFISIYYVLMDNIGFSGTGVTNGCKTAIWILRIELRSSGKAVNVLKC